jgi:RNA polymerase sigma-70 factor (ECF subfamily)
MIPASESTTLEARPMDRARDRDADPRRLPPPPGESSFELIEKARAGDDRALERLCARYLPRLRAWATGRIPRGARGLMDTGDLVQETLVRVVGRLDAFEHRREGALQAYLRQALANRIRDEARRAARRPQAVDADALEWPDLGPSPLEEAIGAETLALYEAALARLRSEDREAIVARVDLETPYEALAEVLDKPSADAARMAVSRALVRLAEEMRRGA